MRKLSPAPAICRRRSQPDGESTGRIGRLLILAMIAAATLALLPAPAEAAKRWYWTEAHAESALGKIGVPYCRLVRPAQRVRIGCNLDGTDPTGKFVVFEVRAAACRGADELGSTFRYSRFQCAVVTSQSPRPIRVAVYPAGPALFRWQVLFGQ